MAVGYLSAPWYFKKKPPIFCNCWRPFYKSIYPYKVPAIVVASILFSAGFTLLLTALITCIAVTCSGGIIVLWPIGITCIWFGLMLLHCGWASHLLDDQHPYNKHQEQNPEAPNPFQTLDPPREQLPPINSDSEPQREAFWQFVDKDPWQAVCSRDRLQ